MIYIYLASLGIDESWQDESDISLHLPLPKINLPIREKFVYYLTPRVLYPWFSGLEIQVLAFTYNECCSSSWIELA